jgi:hypothetical protein
MVKPAGYLLLGVALVLIGCSTPASRVKRLQLGMTPDQVRKEIGSPYTVRASKVYEDGKTAEVWEYIAHIAIYPKDYWLMFENGKLVQWGEPGDFSGTTTAMPGMPVLEYSPIRKTQ